MAFVGSLSSSIATTTIAVTGSLVPGSDNFNDLGTSGNKWRTVFSNNITGSLTRLAGGGEYLKPGSNVTLTTGSDGSVTIAAAGGGATSFFTEAALDKIFTTGSVAIGFNAAASTKGSDVFFAVSGSTPGSNTSLFAGPVVSSGSISVKDSGVTVAQITGPGAISGSALQTVGNLSVQGTSALTGDVTVAGDVAVNGGDITTSALTFNIAASTATTVNIGSAATRVVIPGDLEVQGTTITANVSNITIEDPLIGLGFTSGSVASAAGDRGFIGGIDGVGNNVAWAWSNANSAFVATRTTSTSGSTTVTVSALQPIRASKLEVNGTTAYVTSSDGLEVQVVATNVATVKSTTDKVTLDGATGKGVVFNVGAVAFAELKNDVSSNAQFGAVGGKEITVSGSTVSLNTGGTVNVLSSGNRIGQLGGAAGVNLRVLALDTAGATKGLVLSGSTLDLGANNSNGTISFNFADATKGTITHASNNLTLGTPASTSLMLSGANGLSLLHGTIGASFIRESGDAGYLVVSYDGSGDAKIRAAADLVLGSAGEDIKFQNGSTTVLTLNTAGGNANFKGASNQQVAIGSDGASGGMTVSGSTVTANVGAGGFVFQRDGVAELHVNAASTTTTVSGSASQSVTLAAGTGATTLTLSGSTVEHQATIAHKFNLGGALIAHVTSSDGRRGFFPASDSAFDLGGPSIRWQNIYTGDLHLRNERGDYTLIEESDFLSIRFNKNGKRYKFLVERVPELDER